MKPTEKDDQRAHPWTFRHLVAGGLTTLLALSACGSGSGSSGRPARGATAAR